MMTHFVNELKPKISYSFQHIPKNDKSPRAAHGHILLGLGLVIFKCKIGKGRNHMIFS